MFERNDDGTVPIDEILEYSSETAQFYRDLKQRLDHQHNDIIELRRIIDKETHIDHDDESKGGA